MNLPDHINPIAVEEALLNIGMTINEIRALTGNTAPQIIRTVEELQDLDPDTLLIDWDGEETFAYRAQASIRNLGTESMYYDSFPAVVVAPAEQARAAFEALEEETDND